MLSYSQIIKQAYAITIRYKILWFFGLFVAGGFNLNFLRFQNISLATVRMHPPIQETIKYFTNHPGSLASLSLGILIMSFISLLVTNWARVMLVLYATAIIQNKHREARSYLKGSRKLVMPVTKISLLTSTLMVIVALGFFLPPLVLGFSNQFSLLLWLLGAMIFLPVAFTVSCINIFTTLFVVIFKNTVSASFDLGTDLFINNWTKILGLSILLGILYVACFTVGISVISVLKLFFNQIFSNVARFNFFSLSAMIVIPRLIAGLLIWLFVSGLNVFFNTALLLLFFQLVTPIKTPEAEALRTATEGLV